MERDTADGRDVLVRVVGVVVHLGGHKDGRQNQPVNGEAVDEDWMALLCGGLTETFEEDKDAWSLLIVQARIVAHDDIVQQNVDVRHFMGVERRD